MYPDSEFAIPIGSFQYPVPPPDAEPDGQPLTLPRVNDQWMKYLRGAAKQLLLQATWLTDDPDELALTQQRAMTLIANLDGHVPNWQPNEAQPGFNTVLMAQRGMGINGPFYTYGAFGAHSTMQFKANDTGSQVGGLVNVCHFYDPSLSANWSLVVTLASGATQSYPTAQRLNIDVVGDLGPFEIKQWVLVSDSPISYAVNLKNDFTVEF